MVNIIIKTKHAYVGLLNDDLMECSTFIRIVKKVILMLILEANNEGHHPGFINEKPRHMCL